MIEEEHQPGWHPSGHWFRYLGFRLSWPPPLRGTYFRLEPGVHAIFGPNGVGKTKVLEGLRTALDGRVPDVPESVRHLHLNQVFLELKTDGQTFWDSGLLSEHGFFVAFREHRLQGDEVSRLDEAEVPRLLIEWQSVPDDPRVAIYLYLRRTDSWHALGLRREVAEEIAAAPCLAVSNGVNVGRMYSGTYLCLREQGASPTLRGAIARTFESCEDPQVATDNDVHDESGRERLPFGHHEAAFNWRGQKDRPPWAPIVWFDLLDSGEELRNRRDSVPEVLLPVLWVGDEVEYTHRSGNRYDVDAVIKKIAQQYAYSLWPQGKLDLRPGHSLGPYLDSEGLTGLFERANRYYETILGTSIELTLEAGQPTDLIEGTHPFLAGKDHDTSVPVSRMSATQERWAKAVFLLAWHESQSIHDRPPLVLLIDEPERGLMAGLQRRVSKGLADVSEDLGMPIVVATHSSALIDDLSVHTHRCSRRSDGSVCIAEVPTSDRDQLKKLGVPESEQLALYKVILLVEGLHEEVLLEHTFANQLAEHRIKVLPMRGTRQIRLMAAEVELLYQHFDAPFVLLLDNTRSGPFRRALEEVRSGQDLAEVRRTLTELDSLTDEEQVLRSVLIKAIDSGRVDRIAEVCGLTKTDIVEYLPCDHLVPGSESWVQLREEHQAEPRSLQNRDFKRWLAKSKDADFGTESLLNALDESDAVHDDWVELINICIDVAQGQVD